MRELVNFDSGERLRLGVEGNDLMSMSQKGAKTKQSKKEFASETEAKKACVKKEWESLKKGFILQDSEPKEAKFREILAEQNVKKNSEIASFVCSANNAAVFGMFGQIFTFCEGKISKLGEYKCSTKNHVPILCAALSVDASMLALCTKENELQILNAKNGEILSELRAEFGVLDKICFLDENTLLLRQHLENKLLSLDIKSAKVTKQPWIKDEYLRVSEFCVDTGKLVVIDQSRGYAIDLKSGEMRAEFRLDHVVKNCEAKFINDKLAVRTDYGCFSLYEI